MTRKVIRSTTTAWNARIVAGWLWYEDVRQLSLDNPDIADELEHNMAIRVESIDYAWQQRVLIAGTILTEDINVQMTLRAEKRGQKLHWYAYRRVFGKLYKRYVGDSAQITNKRILEVAQRMPTT